ncbi:hypothetical protein ZIOFF_050775 [Zingiber officinale]|uniref:Uncharacterized protein n=1 Tax=Zingiber officinale TaxID=94328 RepID=A0A8J5G149_ZINOF|nr:hypothetical protein ZIOFF_050775 [Zingiber officinale]
MIAALHGIHSTLEIILFELKDKLKFPDTYDNLMARVFFNINHSFSLFFGQKDVSSSQIRRKLPSCESKKRERKGYGIGSVVFIDAAANANTVRGERVVHSRVPDEDGRSLSPFNNAFTTIPVPLLLN